MTAHAYIAAPGVEGKLIALVDATIVCMNAGTRELTEVSDKIGPRGWVGVVGNVDDFVIISVQLTSSPFQSKMISIQSDSLGSVTK